jgi:cobalt/nickel transport system ATP-binding protein
VLSGIELALAPGERVALLGLNGAGKTSLLLALAGLLPHRGEIEVGGLRLSARSAPEVRARLGVVWNVPEDQLLFPRVLEDVAFSLVQRGLSPAEAAGRARQQLEALGAGELAEASVHRLSHGQKLRVALAGALVARPELLLLDEPSAGLDPPGQRALAGLLRRAPAGMLVATHDLAFAEATCGRFVLLDGGRLAYDGPSLEPVRARWGLGRP